MSDTYVQFSSYDVRVPTELAVIKNVMENTQKPMQLENNINVGYPSYPMATCQMHALFFSQNMEQVTEHVKSVLSQSLLTLVEKLIEL